MAFVALKFPDDSAKDIALVNVSWLSPRKKHTFWLPFKTIKQNNKTLKEGTLPDQTVWDVSTE